MKLGYFHRIELISLASNSKISLPAWAIFTTSEWLLSTTETPFTAKTISPTSSPDVSAGVSGSMADTTTGFEPWILKPNSPDSRRTIIVLSVPVQIKFRKISIFLHLYWNRIYSRAHVSLRWKIFISVFLPFLSPDTTLNAMPSFAQTKSICFTISSSWCRSESFFDGNEVSLSSEMKKSNLSDLVLLKLNKINGTDRSSSKSSNKIFKFWIDYYWNKVREIVRDNKCACHDRRKTTSCALMRNTHGTRTPNSCRMFLLRYLSLFLVTIPASGRALWDLFKFCDLARGSEI